MTATCAANEPIAACTDAAATLLGKLRTAFPNPTEPPLDPAALRGATDVVPDLWLKPSATVDPTKLPLGNRRMVIDAPRAGYVFACDPFMYSMTTIIGATRTGPWIDEAAGTYDVTSKVFDRGRIEWPGQLSVMAEGGWRVIRGNGLPLPGVPTGRFPVPPEDPAYRFDRNPLSILEQKIEFAVPLAPVVTGAPRCVYKEVGITLDGVSLSTGLDSSGRDENAYELNDTCNGKSQPGGLYHRHTMSECTPHIREPGAVVGYALDGFGITGPFDADGSELTTAKLDECHGLVSEITWEGRKVAMYHYVLTRDFPYSVSCFKGTPTRNAFPPLPGAPPQTR
ncbi:MAG: YHYH protein [Acetobacteraceae bacterium]